MHNHNNYLSLCITYFEVSVRCCLMNKSLGGNKRTCKFSSESPSSREREWGWKNILIGWISELAHTLKKNTTFNHLSENINILCRSTATYFINVCPNYINMLCSFWNIWWICEPEPDLIPLSMDTYCTVTSLKGLGGPALMLMKHISAPSCIHLICVTILSHWQFWKMCFKIEKHKIVCVVFCAQHIYHVR